MAGDAQKALRPRRYASELATGVALTPAVMVRHSWDLLTCVHADVDPLVSYVREGTGRDNRLDRTQRNRRPTSGDRGGSVVSAAESGASIHAPFWPSFSNTAGSRRG